MPQFPSLNDPGADNRSGSYTTISNKNYQSQNIQITEDPKTLPLNVPNITNLNQQHSSYARVVKSFPGKKQAILLPSIDNISILDYVISIGRIIGPEKILSASKISKKRVCIYLDSEQTADNFARTYKKLNIDNQQVEVRKLLAPSKKLVLSNVHTCIPNSLLLESLHQHNIKTTSAIFDLHIGITTNKYDQSELQKYTHISSFRRGVYISQDDTTQIPDSLLINFENETHRIFIHDAEIRCHLCHNIGHNSSLCPETDQSFPKSTDLEETEIEMNNLLSTNPQTTAQKRPLSQSDTLSQSQSTELMETENPTSQTMKPHQSSSSTEKPKKPKKRKKTPENVQSHIVPPIKELLKSINQNINEQYNKGHYPLNTSNFGLLLDAVKKKTNPKDVEFEISQFPDLLQNLKGLLSMITENYHQLSHRSIKIRFTKLKNNLLTIQPDLSTNDPSVIRNSSSDSELLLSDSSEDL